jgi:tetratricopeptide (TPR) repeat protein
VHRDLKPANILLSGPPDNPVPKVTDFGVAKELAHANDAAGTRFLGTPSYTAPEQVESKWGPVSERTDVYGIGAVLYEALTGRPPFCADSIGETLRQVTESQPVNPRLLNPAIPRDLETICLKSLQKGPLRRYASAAALADDLERFLSGKPILARPVGPLARAWMWCRREPTVASLTAILLLVLLGGVTGIALQRRRADMARRSAEINAAESHELLVELIRLNRVDPWRQAPPISATHDSLLRAEAHCRKLLEKNPNEINLRLALMDIYLRLTNLAGPLGKTDELRIKLQQAQSLWEPLADYAAGNPEIQDMLASAECMWNDGNVQRLAGFLRAHAIWQKLADDNLDDLELIRKVWMCRSTLSEGATITFYWEEWLRPLDDNRRELAGILGRNPNDRIAREQLALICFLLGEIHSSKSTAVDALPFWRESFKHYTILVNERPANLLDSFALALACSRLIHGTKKDAYYLQAVSLFEQVGVRLRALITQQPPKPVLNELLLDASCNLALSHAKAGDRTKSTQAANDCLTVVTTMTDFQNLGRDARLKYAGSLAMIGHLLQQADQPAAALRLTKHIASLCAPLAADRSRDLEYLYNLSDTSLSLSALANQLGEPALALQQAEIARKAIEEWMRDTLDCPAHQNKLAVAWERIAKARWGLGQRDQALTALREAVATQRRAFDKEPANHFCRVCLSRYYDRSFFYGTRAGDIRGAATAIVERTKLWPGDVKQLVKAADDFNTLAGQVTARSQGHLSAEDQAERARYLAECRRMQQAAEEATHSAPEDLRVQR